MSPRTNSSHNNSPSTNQMTMSSSVTNSPAGLMNNIVNSSPHSNNSLQNNSPHNVQNSNNSPQQINDELLNSQLNNQLNDSNLINNLNSNNPSTNLSNSNENGLNQMILNSNNQSPINNSSLSNSLPVNNLIKSQDSQELKTEFKQEIYNQNTNLNGLISSNSNPNLTNQNCLSPNSLNKMNSKVKVESSLNSSINSSNLPNSQNGQWTGVQKQNQATNFSGNRNYQSTTNNSTNYQLNQFGPNNTANNTNNPNNQPLNSSANLNSSLQPNSINSPYLDFNSTTSYTGSILNQPSTPSCSVPNMFTAAAVAAASSGALCNNQPGNNTSSKTVSNLNNQNSDFSFNNNNLSKKYLEPTATNLPTSGLDQTLFYSNPNNGSTPLNKSTLQSPAHKPLQPEFSTSSNNNYANFAPNSTTYWQPGTAPSQCIPNGSMYPLKQVQPNNLPHHTPPSSGQLDEASQASTPNSQLDELRSDTPNTKLSNNQTNGATYLSSAINGVSNNSSSNSSTSSMASSANGFNSGKTMPTYSFPPTPNTIGSPGASVMSGIYDEYEPVQNATWSKNHRLDGLMKLYEISNEPGRKIFLDKLISFNEERNNSVSSCPQINKNLIDLYRLYTLVKDRGGFVQTIKTKQWKEIASIVLCNSKQGPTSSYILRKQYTKHLLPFECKFDLNGADPAMILAQVESGTRKKRKSKAVNEPPQLPGMQTPPNTMNPNVQMNPELVNKNNLNQINLNQHSNLNQSVQINRHSMQQPQPNFPPNTNGQLNMSNNLSPNGIPINNPTIVSNGPNQFQTGQLPPGTYSTYNNYNNNLPNPNYVTNLPNDSNGLPQYVPNGSIYNQQTIHYQPKLNHQLSSQNQFFTNNSQITTQNQLVNSSQPQIHNPMTSSLPNQQVTLNNQPQFYQQQPNSAMFNNGLNTSNNGPNENFYYTNQSNLVQHSSTNQIYNGSSNQSSNNMQFNEELMKYNTSIKQTMNSPQSNQLNQQLNTSNNTQYYNGYQDSASTNTTYTTVYRQPANNYQINGYTNGVSDSNSFDKNNSNLLDFPSSLKTESNNLDSYLSDPYLTYEPENKRFHAMNC